MYTYSESQMQMHRSFPTYVTTGARARVRALARVCVPQKSQTAVVSLWHTLRFKISRAMITEKGGGGEHE